MDCRTFTEQLDDLLDARLDKSRAGECRAHAEACVPCRSRLEAQSGLREKIRSLPTPAPSAGFADRVFASIRDAHPPVYEGRRPVFHPAVAYALAASLALGLGFAVLFERPPPDTQAPSGSAVSATPVVTMAINEMKAVRLVFRSPRALTGVTVHLELPDGVELAGYPGRHELRWQTDLQSGANLLELPVIVQQGEGGLMTASFSIGQDHRQFSVLVQARQPAVLFLKALAAETTAALAGSFVVSQGGFHHA